MDDQECNGGNFITRIARHEFAKAMRFEEGAAPHIPTTNIQKPRLLYIHVPFCEKLCPYCSFNRIVFDEPLCRDYFRALRKEILLYKERGFDFRGIYVGGGTPTVLIDELEETLVEVRSAAAYWEKSSRMTSGLLGERVIADMKANPKKFLPSESG